MTVSKAAPINAAKASRPQGACRRRHGKHRAAARRIVRASGLRAQARATENLRGFSALRRAAATDPGAVLGSAAARQQPGAQSDRDRQYAWYLAAEFRGDARWPGKPRSLRADTIDQ